MTLWRAGTVATAVVVVILTLARGSANWPQQSDSMLAHDSDAGVAGQATQASGNSRGVVAGDAAISRKGIERILTSKSVQWRRSHLKHARNTLLQGTARSTGESAISLLEALELAHWALGDEQSAKQTIRRRYQLLAHIIPSKQLADQAYAEAARYARKGFENAACELFAWVVRLAPDPSDVVLADYNIGIILRRQRRFKAAEKHFLKVADRYMARHPERARQCHYLAGDCAWRAREDSRAIEIFADLVDRYPGTPEADMASHMQRDVIQGERPEDLHAAARELHSGKKGAP